MAGFKICSGKGFQIEFANGWTISIQFGPSNYCEKRNGDEVEILAGVPYGSYPCDGFCPDAEVAIIQPDGEFYDLADNPYDKVKGWQGPAVIAKLIAWTAAQPASGRIRGADAKRIIQAAEV